MDITDELLADLQRKAKAVIDDNLQYGNECCYDPRSGFTPVEQEFAVAASPEVVDALVEHIRSLTERLGMMREVVKDVLWCIDTGPSCQIGVVERCKCSLCVAGRLRAAIAQEGAVHE